MTGIRDLHDLVDLERGLVSASIYTDEDVYRLELERVFARSWLFLTHESQVPRAGDYVAAYMAEDPVLVVRQKDGSIVAFLNQCRHRGMRICRADAGNARGFTCSYHGWTYGVDGSLTTVPYEERGYRGTLDRSQFGAKRVPRIHNHRGLIFANWDEDAMAFEEYLGDMLWYLDSLADRYERSEFIEGVTRWTIGCNWKLPSEQFASDTYHAEATHISALIALGADPADGGWDPQAPGRQFSSPHGHGAGFFTNDQPDFADRGADAEVYLAASAATATERLGEYRARKVRGHNTIFPNFSYLIGTNAVRVWHPRGPDAIEVWTWTLVDADAPPAAKAGWRTGALRSFSPAGIFEQDDGENWAEIQQVLQGHVARRTRFNVGMGMGLAGDDPDLPGRVSDAYSEEAARGFYGYWAQLMGTPGRDEEHAPR